MFAQRILLAALLILVVAPSSADELIMKDGSRLIGRVISASAAGVVFKTNFAGKITVKRSEVETMMTDTPVTLLMSSGEVIRDQLINISAQSPGLDPDISAQSIALAHIEHINPEPWQLGEGYKWSGRASTALKVEKGNTNNEELDLAGEFVWRSLVNRYTVRGRWEINENEGDKNKESWDIIGKYDRLQTGKDYYWGVNLRLESDRFSDLDLRTYFGPYFGQQFYESKLLTLSGEIGAVWVDEQYHQAENNNYPAANWNVRLTSDYLGADTRAYIDHIGVWDLDMTSDFILQTTFGLGFPLIGGLEAAAEFKLEYDSGAVQGVEKVDETYSFRVGYSW